MRWLSLLALTIGCLYGCAGGGSGPSSFGGSGSGTYSTTVAFNNRVVAPVTPDAKAVAESSLSATWTQITGQSQSAQTTALVAAMKGMPVFRAAGYSGDGSTWGVYTDGTILGLGTNEEPDESAYAKPGSTTLTSGAPSESGKLASVRGTDPTLPGGNVAYLIDSMEPYRNTPTQTIANNLTRAGYQIQSLTGTLADWKGVQNASLMVTVAHGGVLVTDNLGPMYYHQSAEIVTKALETQYAPLIAKEWLAHVINPVFDASGHSTMVTKYGFNSLYLLNSASASMFTKNSLMFNMACSGHASYDFSFALQQKLGLSIYGGWSKPVEGPDSNATASLFFDRALGNQAFKPAAPNNIPETYKQVALDMAATARTGSKTTFATSYSTKGLSTFVFDAASGATLATVVPSISAITVSTTAPTMELDGYFGVDQGTVAADGSNLNIISWTATKIVVAQPTTATAKIQVTSSQLLSNLFSVTLGSFSFSAVSTKPIPIELSGGGVTVKVADNGLVDESKWGLDPKKLSFVWTLGTATSDSFQGAASASPGTLTTSSNEAIILANPKAIANQTDKLTVTVNSTDPNTGLVEQVGVITDTVLLTSTSTGTIVIGSPNFPLSRLLNSSATHVLAVNGVNTVTQVNGVNVYGVDFYSSVYSDLLAISVVIPANVAVGQQVSINSTDANPGNNSAFVGFGFVSSGGITGFPTESGTLKVTALTRDPNGNVASVTYQGTLAGTSSDNTLTASFGLTFTLNLPPVP